MLLQALHVEIEMKNIDLQVTLLVHKGVGTPFPPHYTWIQLILRRGKVHYNLWTPSWDASDPTGISQVHIAHIKWFTTLTRFVFLKVYRWHCFHTHQVFLFAKFTEKLKFPPKKDRIVNDPSQVIVQHFCPSTCRTSQRGQIFSQRATCTPRDVSVWPANWL